MINDIEKQLIKTASALLELLDTNRYILQGGCYAATWVSDMLDERDERQKAYKDCLDAAIDYANKAIKREEDAACVATNCIGTNHHIELAITCRQMSHDKLHRLLSMIAASEGNSNE